MKQEVGLLNKKNEKGMSILEAIVASVIVGIGFIGIFQMVGYAVNSIDVSGERSKAGHLVGMIAEGVLGYKDTYVGVSENDEKALIYEGGRAYMPSDDDRKKCSKFVEFYANLAYAEDSQVCGSDSKTKSGVTEGINIANCSTTSKANRQALFKKDEATPWGATSAAGNQILKWNAILSEDQLIKCKSQKDTKSIKMFEMCRWAKNNCEFQNNNVFDERMYVGRIQFNLNDGKKRRFLYFQADYEPKYQTNTGSEGDGPFIGMEK